jgi:hypothetical protein
MNKNDTLLNPFGDKDSDESDTETVTKELTVEEQEKMKVETIARHLADSMNVDYLD